MATISPEILKQVKAIELRSRGIVSSLFAGDYRSVFRGQGMEFAEVRQYEHGDDFRAIDWNVSARLGTPYIKTFIEEREVTLLLVVDQSGSTHFGTPRSKAALAVEVASILALAAASTNDRAGALLFSDKVERVIPPGKGRKHALRVIRDLLAFQPSGSRTNLAAALRYATGLLKHRSIVVVLSDFLAEGWEQPLRQLGVRHDVVAVAVEDPRETELPDAGWLDLEDAETGARRLVDTGNRHVRGRLRALAEKRREERYRSFTTANVDQVLISTRTDYAPILRRAFSQRARRLHR
jgi:uncharacterized protein (DUF58 family)